jgi:hypothetical protein
MSQLKPMIIVLLMLTSALAGCAGTDTTDLEQQIEDLQQSNDEMNETINNMGFYLQERDTEILTLNSNVLLLQSSTADIEANRDSAIMLLEAANESNEMLELMLVNANNSIQYLQTELMTQENQTIQWRDAAENNSTSEWSNYLAGTDLSGADLTGALLVGASLYGTTLINAYLGGVNLTDSDMNFADLRNAYLGYADLTGADTYQIRLDGVTWDNTICPDGTNSDDNGNTCENNL